MRIIDALIDSRRRPKSRDDDLIPEIFGEMKSIRFRDPP